MREIAIVNGRLTEPEKAAIPVDDWGFRYGWGAFETIRVERQCPLFLTQHLERLQSTAKAIGLTGAKSDLHAEWVLPINRAVRLSGQTRALVNCYWTHGDAANRRQLRIVRVRPFPHRTSRPLRLWLAPWRLEPTSPGIGAKCLSYFPYRFSTVAAIAEGFDEALLLNSAGRVADCGSSSIFVIHGKTIRTPSLSEGCLAGITRGLVLDIARKLAIRATQTRILVREIHAADTVFVTSALRGIVPVAKVGKTRLKTSHPVLSNILADYKHAVDREIARYRDGFVRSR